MTTEQQTPLPRRARMGRSVEVQHGSRGLARMFRRGLHGAKNWVLEPDGDGIPRTPLMKLLRVAVVLAPVWIVLSAATGGPERGGHRVGLGEAILTALLVTLVGLGFLSARERRLGREEPWADLPDIGTPGDDAEPETLVDPAPEAPTEVLENVQVSEVDGKPEVNERVVTPGDIPDVSDQTPQFDPTVATQRVATLPPGGVEGGPFVQVSGGDHPGGPASLAPDTRGDEGGISDALEEETPTLALTPGHPPRKPVTVSLEKGPFSQVNAPPGVVFTEVYEATSSTTHGDEMSSPPNSVWPVAGSQMIPTQGELFPQVAEVATPLAPATAGPYPVSNEPIADDWWHTRPDTEPMDVAPAVEAEASGVEVVVEAESEETQEQEADGILALDRAVIDYRAVRSMPDATEELKEQVRQGAAQWVREEVDAGRQSQRSAARILGVSKTTVANWLGREAEPSDPWADVDVD